ncbi:hypothetical protein NL108_010729, partial [Boleophthalmus pectinirostris]
PPRRTKCKVQLQRSEDLGLLHICSFPESDIFLFDEILLEVLDQTSNSSLYTRKVTVEDNVLPKPPKIISITQNEKIGELQVSWQAKCAFNVYYMIRFSSKSMKEKIKERTFSDTLTGLVPGEEVKVQVSVRCSPNKSTGHWSHWSPHVQAVVPQSADDISLQCYTEDLTNVTCQWDGSIYNIETDYKLFYKMGLSESQGWTKWTECNPQINWTEMCAFYGNIDSKFRIKIINPLAPLSRTFYAEDFKLSNAIKSRAPSHLKQNETDKMCVNWDPPLPALSSHLQYEVNYKPSEEKHWTTISVDGPETAVCLKVSWCCQFNVKIRVKPYGPEYSGQWSDWSEVLTGDVPEKLHITPLIFKFLSNFSLTLSLTFNTNIYELHFHSKLKLYFWPPVPNLDKVLQGFLLDLKQHKWDAPATVKQMYAETTASVVEVLSMEYDSGLEESLEKSAALLSTSDTSYSSVEPEDNSIETELYPDYVALNINSVIMCSKENSYICEDLIDNKDDDLSVEMQQNSPQSSEYWLPRGDSLGVSDFLNHSYLLLATDNLDCKENQQRGHGNIYTNMPRN